MRLIIAAILVLAAASAAQAAPDPSAAPAKPYMDLKPMGLPAVVNRRLVNYVFVDARLTFGKGVDAAKIQDQEPFLRDAVVRAATRTPFNPPQDGVHLDEGRLRAEIMKDAAAQLGPGKIASVEIRSQTPQRRTGVPGGDRP